MFAILPFLIGILLKLFTYWNGGRMQEAAIREMNVQRIPSELTDGQIAVVVKIANFATRKLTAASTSITSVLALLILALKYPHPLIWGFSVLTFYWLFSCGSKSPGTEAPGNWRGM
jgi:hypothetical protein